MVETRQSLIEADRAQEMHRKIVRKFTRRKVITTHANQVHSIDIVQMSLTVGQAITATKKKEVTSDIKLNKGYIYILNIIDVFTRYVWSIPLKDRITDNIIKELENHYKKWDKPEHIWADQEFSEIRNKKFGKWFNDQNIDVYFTYGAKKNPIVERYNQTAKKTLFKIMTKLNINSWYQALPNVTHDYNVLKVHRTIKMTPHNAYFKEKENYDKLLEVNTQQADVKEEKPVFEVGDRVRVALEEEKFNRGFKINFTAEIYLISKVKLTKPVTYRVTDLKGKELKQTYYKQELVKSEF